MTRADLLKPCPFCGGRAILVFSFYGASVVRCERQRCLSSGPERATDAGAIAAWNRRAPITLDEWEDSQ